MTAFIIITMSLSFTCGYFWGKNMETLDNIGKELRKELNLDS